MKKLSLALILLSSFPGRVCAEEDGLAALMKTMKSDIAAKVAYQEIRKLDLLDKPWLGSGYLYSTPPDLMIREQLHPQRLLMAVKGEQMYYFDPVTNTRQQTELDSDDETNLPIIALKALVNGDEKLLRQAFQVEFIHSSKNWTMTLTPKGVTGPSVNIKVSGLPGQAADKIGITQPDGDTSEFTLTANSHDGPISATIDQLYHELLGE